MNDDDLIERLGALRAPDAHAVSFDAVATRVGRRRRRRVVGTAALTAVVVVAAVIGVRLWPQPSSTVQLANDQATGSLACPQQFTLTPPTVDGFDTDTALVPDETPVAALVCDYDGTTTPDSPVLTRSMPVGGRESLAADLVAVRAHAGDDPGVCRGSDPEAPVDGSRMLLMLEYGNGRESVATSTASCNAGGNGYTSNGRSVAQGDLTPTLRAALDSGAWPGLLLPTSSAADHGCADKGFSRAGADSDLLPHTPSSLTICQFRSRTGGEWSTDLDVSRSVDLTGNKLVQVLTATRDAALDPQPTLSCALGYTPDYVVTAHYPHGPDASLTVVPADAACVPPLIGQVRSSQDDAGVRAAIAAATGW